MWEKLMLGPPGFELVSIEPKSPKPINWKDFKRYLDNKYAKGYKKNLLAPANVNS